MVTRPLATLKGLHTRNEQAWWVSVALSHAAIVFLFVDGGLVVGIASTLFWLGVVVWSTRRLLLAVRGRILRAVQLLALLPLAWGSSPLGLHIHATELRCRMGKYQVIADRLLDRMAQQGSSRVVEQAPDRRIAIAYAVVDSKSRRRSVVLTSRSWLGGGVVLRRGLEFFPDGPAPPDGTFGTCYKNVDGRWYEFYSCPSSGTHPLPSR